MDKSTSPPPAPGKHVKIAQNPSLTFGDGLPSPICSPGTTPPVHLFLPQRLTCMDTQLGHWLPLSLGPEEGKKEFGIFISSTYILSYLLVRSPRLALPLDPRFLLLSKWPHPMRVPWGTVTAPGDGKGCCRHVPAPSLVFRSCHLCTALLE